MKYYPLILCLVLACSGRDTSATEDLSDTIPEESILAQTETDDSEEEYNEEEFDECIFDLSSQTSEFLEGITEFRNFKWDDEAKIASILLDNGDSLYVRRGGCTHFEVAITLLTQEKKNVMDTAFWLTKAKSYADKIYDNYDKHLLDSLITHKIYKSYDQEGNLYVAFEGHNFSEFYEYVSRQQEKVKMELIYYMD